MTFKKPLLGFPFLNLKTNTPARILPKFVLAAALFRSSGFILPKTLIDNFYKGMVALTTRPFDVGDKIRIDKYDGVVKDINFWYLKLDKGKGYVFIPTSHVYNAVIELSK